MTDVIHIRGETETLNAYDAMGLLPMQESATPEELQVAAGATYGYLSTEDLLEDCGMPVREVDPGYQAYLDSFAEVEAIGDLVAERTGLPVTVNGNDIRSAREAYDLGVSVGVLPPLEGDQSLQPMREAGPQDAETGAALTGSECADCQGTGLMAGVMCEDCGGSGLMGVSQEPGAVEESADDDAQAQLAQRREQRRRQQQTEQQQMEEGDDAVGSYMDDLDDDEDDDLESASSLNSGKKQRKPESSSSGISGTADENTMVESGRTWQPINEKVALQAMADAGVVVTPDTKLPSRSPDADDWEATGGEAQEADLLKLVGLPTVG